MAAMAPPEPGVRVEPFDRFNRELVANVRPDGWVNPEPRGRYHLVVIGAGTGGLVTAAIAAGLGARVALVERHLMGGDCLNVGCVPSKGMIGAARSWQAAAESGRRFGGPAEGSSPRRWSACGGCARGSAGWTGRAGSATWAWTSSSARGASPRATA
jgi:NADPH-dependent 2,4-dienoyl-CoA reductase/sulfur reductase-like enzyme